MSVIERFHCISDNQLFSLHNNCNQASYLTKNENNDFALMVGFPS